MEVSRNQASCVDAALLARVAKGDIRAFDQLYEQTSPILYALAVRVLNNRDDAAELLQEVYVEAWRKPQGGMPQPTGHLYLVGQL